MDETFKSLKGAKSHEHTCLPLQDNFPEHKMIPHPKKGEDVNKEAITSRIVTLGYLREVTWD
jgi:hypothetical protein